MEKDGEVIVSATLPSGKAGDRYRSLQMVLLDVSLIGYLEGVHIISRSCSKFKSF